MGMFNKKREYERFKLQLGHDIVIFRFNIIETVSSRDKPILMKALEIWIHLATATYDDYSDFAEANINTIKKQMEFYRILESLQDKELENEMDRAFQSWLNL